MEYNSCPEAAPVFAAIFLLVFSLISLLMLILIVLIYCRIFAKAGYSWALGLLMLVPIANLIMLLILAFSDWPIQKELRLLKQQKNEPG